MCSSELHFVFYQNVLCLSPNNQPLIVPFCLIMSYYVDSYRFDNDWIGKNRPTLNFLCRPVKKVKVAANCFIIKIIGLFFIAYQNLTGRGC